MYLTIKLNLESISSVAALAHPTTNQTASYRADKTEKSERMQ